MLYMLWRRFLHFYHLPILREFLRYYKTEMENEWMGLDTPVFFQETESKHEWEEPAVSAVIQEPGRINEGARLAALAFIRAAHIPISKKYGLDEHVHLAAIAVGLEKREKVPKPKKANHPSQQMIAVQGYVPVGAIHA